MPYRIKIGGEQFQADIEGAGEWSRSVTRDFSDRIFRTRGEYRFIGHEGLYNLLYNHISIKGVCEALEGRIYFNTGTSWDYEWRGDIKPQDWQFDLLKKNVEGQVLDASWSAKINNNQDQKINLRSSVSYNQSLIPDCEFKSVAFFNPSTGVYDANLTTAFKVFDVFTFLIDYYTDGTVSFESDYYSTGLGAIRFITTGYEIRERDNSINPEISFSDLFEELNKQDNLFILIEGDQDNPTLRIEPFEYIVLNKLLFTVVDPENIKVKTDLDQLYSVVKIGANGTSVDYDNNASYSPNPLDGWETIELNANVNCTFENNSLDLDNTWKVDHNSIEKQISERGNDTADLDDDIFIVDIEQVGLLYFAIKYSNDYAVSLDSTYNQDLNNRYKLIRWQSLIQSSLTKAETPDIYVRVNAPIQTFYDSCINGCTIFFDDDSTPPNEDLLNLYTTYTEGGGSLGNKTNDFKPTVAGYYDWYAYIPITGRELGGGTLTLVLTIYEDDTQLNAIQEIDIDTLADSTGLLNGTARAYLRVGNVGVIRVKNTTGNRFFISGASYITIENGDIQLPDTDGNPYIFIYEAAQFKLSRADFDTLNQGQGFVRILDTNANKAYDVWAKDVKYNSTTGVVEVGEWIGNTPPIELCWVLESGSWNDGCYWLDNEILALGCDDNQLANGGFQDNPVGDWTKVGGVQTGGDPAVFNIGAGMTLRQTITIPNGDYRLYYKFSGQTSGKSLLVSQSVSVGSVSVAVLFSNSDEENQGSIDFTAAGVTAATYTLTFTPGGPGVSVQADYIYLCQV